MCDDQYLDDCVNVEVEHVTRVLVIAVQWERTNGEVKCPRTDKARRCIELNKGHLEIRIMHMMKSSWDLMRMKNSA